jgi:serine/threonine-protein phosphatase 2A regulatory subunit A
MKKPYNNNQIQSYILFIYFLNFKKMSITTKMPNLEDTEQSFLIGFVEEYYKSDDFKKASLIIESLKSENQPIRLFCAKRLTDLGNILGVARIEDELIPFITDLILNFENDGEILSEYSNQILNLLIILKKNNRLSFIGIRSLEILSGNDDEIVRQTAINNLSKLIELLDEQIITNEIFPLMKRLIENDLKTKMSCCYLFPIVYPKLENSDIKKELLQVYSEISKDESPSVRRAAADNIKFFCKVEENEVISLLFKLYNDFIKDSVDIVKIYTIQSTPDLLNKLSINNQEKLILNFTKSMAEEKAWRVKYSAIECIAKISENINIPSFEKKYVSLLMLFLKDREAEVKCAVLNYFEKFINLISINTFKINFLPLFKSISNDNNLHVRSSYANTLLKCIPYFKQDEQLINNITPIINKLLKDEIVEVQYATIENIDKIILLSKEDESIIEKYIMPIIKESMNVEKKWRFRCIIAENILKIISDLDSGVINKYFLDVIIKLFYDHAYDIRLIVWKIIEKLVNIMDDNFIQDKIWETQKLQMKNNNYILRISAMKSIDYLKQYYKKEFIMNEIIPYIINNIKDDKIPNVKFSACEVLESLVVFIGKEEKCKKFVEDFLNGFFNDKDDDVVFISKSAFNELQK